VGSFLLGVSPKFNGASPMTNEKTQDANSNGKPAPFNGKKSGGDGDAYRKGVPLGDNAGVHIPSAPPDTLHGGHSGIEIDFAGFIISFSTSCMVNLGKYENPETGAIEKDLDAAQQVIHILTMLRDKTRGNLEADEERLLSSLIHDLKLAYVQASSSARRCPGSRC
jgi:hypothetical protein